MARGAELPIGAGRGDLGEHVLIKITLGVPVIHRDLIDQVHCLLQEVILGDGEARILHVVRVGGITAVGLAGQFLAQEREDALVEDSKHFGFIEVLELRPPHILVRTPELIGTFGEDRILNRLAGPRGFAFCGNLVVVKPLEEQQVGDLLDDLQRVGDASRPKSIPHAVYLRLQFPGNHAFHLSGGNRHLGSVPARPH